MMDRRLILAQLGATTISMRIPVASAQALSRLPVIGFLNSQSRAVWGRQLAGFHVGLGDEGFRESESVAIEYRWAAGQLDLLPALASDLVARRVDVLAATGGTAVALAAMRATTTTPVVFITGADPVEVGLVASLGRPGGNLTGFALLTVQLGAKRLGLLHEVTPHARIVAALSNPDNLGSVAMLGELHAAARAMGKEIYPLSVRHEREFGAAFASLVAAGADALLVTTDPYLTAHAAKIVALADHHKIQPSTNHENRSLPADLCRTEPTSLTSIAVPGVTLHAS
jgi:putative tryptophan/tyrosine transport system substrate-binding protein